MAGFVEACRKAGHELRNPRNAWSAVKADGGAVALTVWADEIQGKGTEMHPELREHPLLADWRDRQGNRQRIEDIRHGLDHCAGVFDIIPCGAVDPKALPRKVQDAQLWGGLKGHIAPETFDAQDGTYRMTFFAA